MRFHFGPMVKANSTLLNFSLPLASENGLSLATRSAVQLGSIAAYIGVLYPLKCCITSQLKQSIPEEFFTFENVINSK